MQTAQGLAAAHRKGIVHRDLKPENLFLTTDGRVKILDFGLAKLTAVGVDSEEVTASHPTKPGVLMGTVAYMSPEQVKAQPVDARSDLFSFGVVLYELLARKHPFRRETVAATLSAILEETPPELDERRSRDPAGGGRDRAAVPGEAAGGALPGGARPGAGARGGAAAPTGAAFLQEVEERSPYPGLSSFTERDAAVFFGREAEVKGLWERIRCAEAARGDRALGGGQDVVPARRRHGLAAGGMGGGRARRRARTRRSASRGRSRPSWPGTRRRSASC